MRLGWPHDKGHGRRGYRGRVAADAQTIAERLAAAGYRSFLSGKWHLGTNDPTQHGFEEFYGTLVSAKTFWIETIFCGCPKTENGESTARTSSMVPTRWAITLWIS